MVVDRWGWVIGGVVALTWAGLSGAGATLDARLIDAEKAAAKRSATVEVQVTGMELVDSAKAMERPRPGEGHVHYRMDDGPIIATTATKLSFHDLAVGRHRLRVDLVGNDHIPLGPSESLEIAVPEPAGSVH